MKKQALEPYIPALTGLRFIAVLLVYFHHFNPIPKEENLSFLSSILDQGYVGVTLFFVLSGFIITYRYFLNPQNNLKNYFWNRFTKIYPIYFLLTVITFGTIAIYYKKFTAEEAFALLMNLSLLKGFFRDLIFTGIAQGWTLTVEEMFYALAPLLALAWFRWREAIWKIAILLLGTGMVLKAVFSDLLPYGFIPDYIFFFNLTFFGRCLEFLLGMFLAYSLSKGIKIKYLTLTGSFISLSCMATLAFLSQPDAYGDETYIGIFINNLILPAFGLLPLYLGLIYEKTWLSQLLSSKPLKVLGDSSYVFYLVHMGIFHDYLVGKGFGYWSTFLTLYVFAIALYYLFEKPVKLWLREKVSFPN